MKQSELNNRTVHAAIGAGIAQVFKDLSTPFPLIRKPQVGGSNPLAGSIINV